VKLAALGVLVMAITVLILTGIAVSVAAGRAGPLNAGPHGFSEIALRLHLGDQQQRLGVRRPERQHAVLQRGDDVRPAARPVAIIVPVLALAGALAVKEPVAASAGTFRTDKPMFAGLLVGVILIVGALTFFPAVSLGPIVEQFSHGRFF